MKHLSILLILLLFGGSLSAQHQVTFVVTLNENIQQDSVYVSGTFNNWIDKPDEKYRLQPIEKNKKTITLNLQTGEHWFRFHRGSFEKDERTDAGFYPAQRKTFIKKDTVINAVIESWKDKIRFVPVISFSKELIDNNDVITWGEVNSWYFKKGNDRNGARIDQDTSKWLKLRPFDVDESLADKNGRREGWFRTYIKVDSSMINEPIRFKFGTFGAADVYLDGKLIHSYGATGRDKQTYNEYSPVHHLPIHFMLNPGQTYVFSIHIVDYLVPLVNESHNKTWPLFVYDKEAYNMLEKHIEEEPFFNTIWLLSGTLLCLLFWMLSIQNAKEKTLRLIAMTSTSLLALSIVIWMPHNIFASAFVKSFTNDYIAFIVDKLFYISSILLLVDIFKRKRTRALKVILVLFLFSAVPDILWPEGIMSGLYMFFALSVCGYYIITSRKSLKGAQWFIVAGVVLTYLHIIIALFIIVLNPLLLTNTFQGLIATGAFLSLPISLLLYISLRFKEFIREVQQNAERVVQLSEEKKQQALQQQKLLEEEVARQTVELRYSLETLQTTQSQLIQSEKMASLGELTAGIAHEIQNPLNFVNNFSDVSIELISEMKDELEKGDTAEAIELATDIQQNLEKINHHGRRADSIVKGMLQHSRAPSGERELTDLNALADEYLRLAFHGLRAKDQSFNSKLVTDFDPHIGRIDLVPQDMGRVILNLLTNAFYAVDEKAKSGMFDYEPIVSISTSKEINKILLSVKDNGNGIPQSIVDKIFQPFFTTKPTGQGTGLGLSLAYDIVKAHDGELQIKTTEGEGSEFIISIPIH